jgi:hypothetical protein
MAKALRLTVEQLAEQLENLERELGMTPVVFYDRFRDGELGDSLQVMHWAGICYMALRAGVLIPNSPSSEPVAR